MRPGNAVYVGGPPLDPLDDAISISCKHCSRKFKIYEWTLNQWHCPGCHEEDAAGPAEED
jgi:PHP family Zn ribbon phosphoesterase